MPDPTIPADLRALLTEHADAADALDEPPPDADHQEAATRSQEAEEALREWTRTNLTEPPTPRPSEPRDPSRSRRWV